MENINPDEVLQELGIIQEEKKIETLDPELLNNTTMLRYQGADWFEEANKYYVYIIGLGGIGSNLVYQLGRTNPKRLFGYDPDLVEEKNLGGQLYCRTDIGYSKSNMMTEFAINYCHKQGTSFRFYKEKIEKISDSTLGHYTLKLDNSIDPKAIFLGLDNMESRKKIFESLLEDYEKLDYLFVDARCSPEYICIYSFLLNDKKAIRKYREEMFSDKEAIELPCSYKQTTYTASMCASLMTNIFVNHLKCRDIPEAILPFKTQFNTNNLSITIE